MLLRGSARTLVGATMRRSFKTWTLIVPKTVRCLGLRFGHNRHAFSKVRPTISVRWLGHSACMYTSRGQEATPEIEAIRSFVIDRVPAELGLRRGSDRVGER